MARDALDLAEDLARRAALALDNARLYSQQLHATHALQRSLLPPELPDIPGVELAAAYEAAGDGNEVGGDFYDVFEVAEGRWRFAIGDVCGKGPEAAAVTGLTRHALRILAREGHDVPAVLERLNALIAQRRFPGAVRHSDPWGAHACARRWRHRVPGLCRAPAAAGPAFGRRSPGRGEGRSRFSAC